MRKLLLLMPLTLLLQGCWFVFIPGPLVAATADAITGAEGNHCVSHAARVGDTITIDGKNWKVRSLSGESSRCSHLPHYPIRAKLDPQ